MMTADFILISKFYQIFFRFVSVFALCGGVAFFTHNEEVRYKKRIRERAEFAGVDG